MAPRAGGTTMVDVLSLDPAALEPFLERHRANPNFPLEMSLADNLVAVLRKANEFVPSAAGSILLDDPREKGIDRRGNRLTFLAAFGEKADLLVGQSISAARGIAGHVYHTGESYFTEEARHDPIFDAAVDQATRYTTESVVAIPIRIGKEVCGVLELINRQGDTGYSDRDRNLLEIFAGYISISIQNVLDGRLAQELAKRDNLTGLFNDRFLHSALQFAIARCRAEDRDLGILFLDLDFFKYVNDRHGHLTGSQVLREIGRLLGRAVGGPGAIVARYGGDEFVVAVPGLGLAEATDLAETLRREVAAQTYCQTPGEIQPEPVPLTGVTCSVGVASLRHHIAAGVELAEAKSTLLRLADTAMYQAKDRGRDRVCTASTPANRTPV